MSSELEDDDPEDDDEWSGVDGSGTSCPPVGCDVACRLKGAVVDGG